MEEKKKTIKNATDNELDALLVRLTKERELQNLIRRLQENSNPMAYRYGERSGVSTETPIEDLYHYGVKGMRWGVRKGKGTPSAKKDSVKNLSDAELKKRISRMQMEKQYKQLTSKEKSKGRKLADDILREVAKETAKKYVAKYVTKGVEAAIKSAMKG